MDARDQAIQQAACEDAIVLRADYNYRFCEGFREGHRQGFEAGRQPDWREASDAPTAGDPVVAIYKERDTGELRQHVGPYWPHVHPTWKLQRWYAIPDYTGP